MKKYSSLESNNYPISVCKDIEPGCKSQHRPLQRSPGLYYSQAFPSIVPNPFSLISRLGEIVFDPFKNIRMIMFLYEILFSLQWANGWLMGNYIQAITFGCLSSFLLLIFNPVTHVLGTAALVMIEERPLLSLLLAHLYYLLGMLQRKLPFEIYLCKRVNDWGWFQGKRDFGKPSISLVI